ncbi:MAG: hypothetical protein WD354_04345 [Acidimicrobiia bacterium]
MELIIALSLFVLIGLCGALAGVDSRDGLDWHSKRKGTGPFAQCR